MAGESPGRSEERKSSGETAPGERDTRPARGDAEPQEPKVSSKPSGSSEPSDGEGDEDAAVRVDQPTAVFKAVSGRSVPAPEGKSASAPVKEPVKEEDGEGAQDDEAAEAGAVSGGASGASGASGEDGDATAGVDQPTAVFKAVSGRSASAPEGKSASAPVKEEDGEGAGDDEAAGAGETGAGTPVDQPTAVFKALPGRSTAAGSSVAKAGAGADPTSAAADDADGTDDTDGADDGKAGAPRPAATGTGTGPDDAAGAKDGEEAGDDDAAVAGDTGAGTPVDQPTAVFKAVQRTSVDQPTTALKTVAPKAAAPKAGPAPESAAERTSKFVPLRGDDVRPAAKKPQAGASVPAPKPAPASAAKPEPKPAAGPASAPAAKPEGDGTPPPSLTEAERTKQQPVPPRPPLDLLAELTNTPPPPETPVRTVMRRVKIWTPLVVLLAIVFAVVQYLRPLPAPELGLSGSSTYAFEGGQLRMPWPGEGQGAVEVEGVGMIGTYGPQKPAPIASVAKTMTAYVILKNHPITGEETGPLITVDEKAGEQAKAQDESTAPIKAGQKYTEKQMLQLLMIPSGNNVARLLARWDAKSEEEFVKKMNDAAKDLGMTNTTYTDPSGLEATTVSTPVDQLKLGKAVMQNDVFRSIVNMPQVEIPGIDKMIYNNNTILLEDGVSGIKTGSSTPAGGNLLWTADTVVDGKERRIVGVVMGAQNAKLLDDKLKLAVNKYSLDLIKAAQKGVTSATVVKKGDVVGYVDDGLGGRTPVVATKDVKAVGWPGLEVELRIGDGGKAVPHSAPAGTVVGEVSIGTGTGRTTTPVALQHDLAEPGFGARLTRVG